MGMMMFMAWFLKKKTTKSHFYFLAGQLCFFISIKF